RFVGVARELWVSHPGLTGTAGVLPSSQGDPTRRDLPSSPTRRPSDLGSAGPLAGSESVPGETGVLPGFEGVPTVAGPVPTGAGPAAERTAAGQAHTEVELRSSEPVPEGGEVGASGSAGAR